MKWVLLATAPDQLTAEMWCGLVQDAGFRCQLRPGDTTSFLGLSTRPVRLLTPEQDEERAREALDAILGRLEWTEEESDRSIGVSDPSNDS